MKIQQSSYSSGVVAPALRYNTDLEMWRSALGRADNCYIKMTGGVSNRPGTRHVGSTTNDEPGRIIRFARSVDDIMGLVFGDNGSLRQLKGGVIADFQYPSQGLDQDGVYLASNDYFDTEEGIYPFGDGMSYEIEFTVKDWGTLAVTPDLDGMCGYRIITDSPSAGNAQVFFRPFKAFPNGNWSSSTSVGTVSFPMDDQKHLIRVDLGNATSQVLDDNGRAIKFAPNATVSLDGGTPTALTVYNGAWDGASYSAFPGCASHAATDPNAVTEGVCGVQGSNFGDMDFILHRYSVYNTAGLQINLIPALNDPAGDPPAEGYMVDSTRGVNVYSQRSTAASPTWVVPSGDVVVYPAVASPYAVADLPEVRYAVNQDAVYFTHPDYPEYALTRYGEDFWQMEQVTYGSEAGTPTGLTLVDNTTNNDIDIQYVVSAVDSSGVETSPSDAVATTGPTADNWTQGKTIDLEWDVSPEADRYLVYKKTRGYFGYIGTTLSTSFVDDNIEPDVADGPREFRTPLSEERSYATAVSVHQQRKFYGGSLDNRNRAWATVLRTMSNLSVSFPLKDTDSIEADLVVDDGGWIQHMLSAKDLLAFTNNGTWNVNSGSLREGIAYRNIRFDLEDDEGCSYVRPLKAGRSVLMVPTFRKGVRELKADYIAQGTQGRDLELMSQHLFEGDRIVDWDYQRDEERLYCVMESGKCNVLTYIPEQGMLAWSVWETDGSYENVCVLPGDERYIPYFIVRRTGYTEPSPWTGADLSSTSLDTTSDFDINLTSDYPTDPRSLRFSPDGTRMYVLSTRGNPTGVSVKEYILDPAGGISNPTESYEWDVPIPGHEDYLMDISADGSYLFTISKPSSIYDEPLTIKRFPLSTPWRLSTIGVADQSLSTGLVEYTAIKAFLLDGVGSRMYFNTPEGLVAYTMPNTFSLDGAALDYTETDSKFAGVDGMAFNSDGSELLVTETGGFLQSFAMSTVWDIRTAGSVVSQIDLNVERSLFVNTDGSSIFSLGSVYRGVRVLEFSGALTGYTEGTETTVRNVEEGVERLPGGVLEDGVFLDDSISMTSGPSQYIIAEHLRSQTVTGLIDGEVVEGIQVGSDGLISLDQEADKAHIGRPYQSDAETLGLNYGSQEGTGFADKKNIPQLTLALENTKGIEVGQDSTNLVPFVADEDASGMINGKYDSPVVPDWNNYGKVHIRQSKPLPFTLLSHISDGQGGDV